MYVNPLYKFMYDTFDAMLVIQAPANTRSLSHIDPVRIKNANNAFLAKAKEFLYDRIDRNQMKWCYTSFPTQALAQEAEMGLEEYENFVFNSCKLNESDTEVSWKELSQRHTD